MEDLLKTLQLIQSILFLCGIPLLVFWGRKYFADKGQPEKVEQVLRAEITKMESSIRQDLNAATSNISAFSIQQHGSITTQLADIKRVIDSAMERANTAHDKAIAAIHQADMAETKISALDRLLNTKLDNLTSQMRGIEKLLESANSSRPSTRKEA